MRRAFAVGVLTVAMAGLAAGQKAKSLGGKPLCTATRTTDCVKALGADGSLTMVATLPADGA
jgi:hypothetical protein